MATEAEVRKVLESAGITHLPNPIDALQTPELAEHVREAETTIRSVFVDAGVDVDMLAKVQSDFRTKLDEAAEAQHRQAVEHSEKAGENVRRSLADKLALIDSGVGGLGGTPLDRHEVILDKPFLIQPSSLFITGENTSPNHTWVKADLTETSSGEEQISFYYMWQNEHSTSVTIDAAAFVGFNGYCSVKAESSFYSSATSKLYLFAALVLKRWSKMNDLDYTPEVLDLQEVVRREVTAVSLLDKTSAGPVNQTHELKTGAGSWLHIDSGELCVFEIAVVFNSRIDRGGHASYDFDSGAYEIFTPRMAIGVWHF